jgi:hypothetical protein
MGAYAQYGERLIERGFAAIPIMPGTKRPGFLCAGVWVGLANWQKRFSGGPPPEDERTRWTAGDTGVGVIAGQASHGLVAIDIDSDDSAIQAAIIAALPATTVKKTGAKGETLFFFGPAIAASKSWNIGDKRVVDLIGPGRQTVLPPSIHPDTKAPYRWSGPDTLEDLAPSELPELTPDVVDRISAVLAPFGYEPEAEPHTRAGNSGEAETPFREINDLALANLDAWVPALALCRCRRKRGGGYEAVPVWRPSTTGRPLEKRHLNLKIIPDGIRDFGADQGYTPLDLVMAACCCDLDTAFGFLNARLGWAPSVSTLDEPKEEARARQQANLGAKKPSGEIPAMDSGRAADKAEQLDTNAPGALGSIVDWIVATARRHNRVLALGAAIVIIGTLIGRRVAGPTRSATHLYVVPIAGTGNGKQHALDAVMRLMRAAKAEHHIGPSKFFSLSAVHRMLMDKPLALCVQDEIGVFLRSVTSRKASSHELAVSQMLRTLWGVSFASTPTAQWASQKMSVIACPAVSIFGVSTPEEFYGALQGESVNNGFLNRFLTLVSEARPADADPELDPGVVPPQLSEELHRLYVWSGPESLIQIGDPEISYTPDVLPWANDQAHRCYQDFSRMIEQHMDDEPDVGPYIARCGEIAIRLATIRAAGRWGRGATVDVTDVEWGAGIAWIAGRSLAERAGSYLPDNDRGLYRDKIAALIRRRGQMKPRDIQQFIRGRLKSAEIKDILGQLVEGGEIEWTSDGYRPL